MDPANINIADWRLEKQTNDCRRQQWKAGTHTLEMGVSINSVNRFKLFRTGDLSQVVFGDRSFDCSRSSGVEHGASFVVFSGYNYVLVTTLSGVSFASVYEQYHSRQCCNLFPFPFLNRPSPFLPDWFHGLSDHLMILLGSKAGFVYMVC